MRKPLLALAALTMVASAAPIASQASHCNNVYFFSRPVAVVEHNAVLCTADGAEDTEARVFVPGSTGFTVRYVNPESSEPAFYWVDLTGSLFPTPRRVKANKITLADGATVAYETDLVSFPGGRTSVGCVTAVVDTVDDELNSNTYRTLGSTC